MKKEKTAVEFLEEALHGFIHPEHGKDFLPILDQAKQMEKEQMNKMYDHAVLAILDGNSYGHTFDEYYESKYGKDENKAENND